MKYQLIVSAASVLSLFFSVGIQAAFQDEPVDTRIEYKVSPLHINLSSPTLYKPYSDYVRPLLENLSQQRFYRIKNGVALANQYAYQGVVNSSDRKKTILGFKHQAGHQWGYLTTSVASKSSANAFVIENNQQTQTYALVLKGVKICVVSKASGLPAWRKGKWSFATKPGYFECTGSTRSSIFKGDSGFPHLLGPYYTERDTVLTFTQPQALKKVLLSLKRQFPTLAVPALPRYEEPHYFVYRRD